MKLDVCLSAVETVTINTQAEQLPVDYLKFVNRMGNRYRDDFTRSVLYLINKYGGETKPSDAVVLASRYGNLASMTALSQLAIAQSTRISAQLFPNATTSSAATYVNIEKKLCGGNITLNGGDGNPIMALYYACSELQLTGHTQHVFVGDCLTDLAVEDLQKRFGSDDLNSADDRFFNHVTYVRIDDHRSLPVSNQSDVTVPFQFYFNKNFITVFDKLTEINCWVVAESQAIKADIADNYTNVRFFSPVHQSILLNEWALTYHRKRKPLGMMMIRENGWLEGVVI